jgi:hypothetical protein
LLTKRPLRRQRENNLRRTTYNFTICVHWTQGNRLGSEIVKQTKKGKGKLRRWCRTERKGAVDKGRVMYARSVGHHKVCYALSKERKGMVTGSRTEVECAVSNLRQGH